MPTRRTTVIATAALAAAWIGGLSLGFRALETYENTPGSTGVVPESWPQTSAIKHATDRPTLVLFAHPLCPCTRATLGELAEIMAAAEGKLSAFVVFLKPDDTGADWDDTELQRTAASIPGVTILSDRAGTEAKRFGAQTSGYTLLFAADGHRLFAGGITASRGHAGANIGQDAIIALANKRDAPHQTRVFGCSFISPAQIPGAAACPTTDAK